MNHFLAGLAVAVMLLPSAAFTAAIDRIDIFDGVDNHLLFVTFEYDSAGNNTGRTVYAGDSTFLRSTSLTRDADGYVTSESSFDYEGNPFSTTKLAIQSGKTDFTMKSQFDMDFLGAPVSVTKGAAGAYSISQSGGVQYTQKYLFDGEGTLTRIEYADASGGLLYYAKVTQRTGTLLPLRQRNGGRPSFVVRNGIGGTPVVTFAFAEKSEAVIELFTPAGRLAASIASGKLAPGRHSIALPHGAISGSGAYITRITVNGSAAFFGRLIVTR